MSQRAFPVDLRSLTPAQAAALGEIMSSRSSDGRLVASDSARRKNESKVRHGSNDESLETAYRIWVGNLGNETNDEMLRIAFSRFSSLNSASVVKERAGGKSRGFGFVSFCESSDMISALKEMDGKLIGSRPCTLKRAQWAKK